MIYSKLIILSETDAFRVKQLKSGLCWGKTQGNDMTLTSTCKDVFQFNQQSRMKHLSSGRWLRVSDERTLSFGGSGGNAFVLFGGRAFMKLNSRSSGNSMIEKEDVVEVKSKNEIQDDKRCTGDERSIIKILPG